MRGLVYLLIVLGLTATVSCGGNSAQRDQEVRDSLRVDSINKDSIRCEELKRDSLRRDSIVKDSIHQDSMWRYRETPDLALFELHGPVKSVAYKGGFWGYFEEPFLFNESGQLISASKYKIYRDGKGRIKTFYRNDENGESEIRITCDSQNRAIEIVDGCDDCGSVTSIKYNKKGFAISSYGSELYDGELSDISTSYKCKNIDDFENWNSRSCIRTKTITNDCEGFTNPTTTKTTIETRTITYYER